MEKFGVDRLFAADHSCCTAKAVVANIAHIPEALAVMPANATMPDFDPEGSLALKPWFGSDQCIALPSSLAIPVVEAVAPYNEQASLVNRRVSAIGLCRSNKTGGMSKYYMIRVAYETSEWNF